MAAIDINRNNFQAEVMQSDKKVLLDFWDPGAHLAGWWFLWWRKLRKNGRISRWVR